MALPLEPGLATQPGCEELWVARHPGFALQAGLTEEPGDAIRPGYALQVAQCFGFAQQFGFATQGSALGLPLLALRSGLARVRGLAQKAGKGLQPGRQKHLEHWRDDSSEQAGQPMSPQVVQAALEKSHVSEEHPN